MTAAQIITTIIAVFALAVSVATFLLNLRDRRRSWDDQVRAQAAQVAGWVTREMCEEHGQLEWKAHVRNGSKSAIYDVLYVLHDSADLDAALPEMIPQIPPETTWSFNPTWWGGPLEYPPTVYMIFRDAHGKAWQRDAHGRLSSTRRPIDHAPPSDPVTGRIDYSRDPQRHGHQGPGK